MRIIGGEFRSRRLKAVPGDMVRPTPDRLRESLFAYLRQDIRERSPYDISRMALSGLLSNGSAPE